MSPSGANDVDTRMVTIGILEVQGAFLEHKVMLHKANEALGNNTQLDVIGIRNPDDVNDSVHGLIIPGGESTTISLYLKRNKMEEPLRKWIQNEAHVTWGTCAGMILLSKYVENQMDGGQHTLGVMNTDVSRNFFGRQVHSFESTIQIKDEHAAQSMDIQSYQGVFIRAPAVLQILDKSVKVLATLDRPEVGDSVIVAAQQGNVFSTAFHPELTDDCSWHKFFLGLINKRHVK